MDETGCGRGGSDGLITAVVRGMLPRLVPANGFHSTVLAHAVVAEPASTRAAEFALSSYDPERVAGRWDVEFPALAVL